jgi:hypothetical protein
MNEYEVFFELYGKKMRTKIVADNEEYAKDTVIQNINFCKVVKQESPKEPVKDAGFNNDESFTFLMGIFGLKS